MNQLPPAVRLMGIGWYFAVCIVAGVLGGFYLDKVTGTTPWLTLLGMLLGFVVAFYGAYRMLVDVLRADQDRKE